MKIDIGISTSHRESISQGLKHLLADSYTLYLKTHNFHWNVTGPQFSSLHAMFEQQYMDLATAVDLIAERIRALGFRAPGSYKEFSQLTSIQEETRDLNATEMIQELIKGQEAVIKTARSLVSVVEEAQDEASMDLLTQRMQHHEKTAWMLRSLLD